MYKTSPAYGDIREVCRTPARGATRLPLGYSLPETPLEALVSLRSYHSRALDPIRLDNLVTDELPHYFRVLFVLGGRALDNGHFVPLNCHDGGHVSSVHGHLIELLVQLVPVTIKENYIKSTATV